MSIKRSTSVCACIGSETFVGSRALPMATQSDAIYRWNTKLVSNHFCSACGCAVWVDSPAYQHDGSWDGKTRRVSINARLLDDFEATDWPITVIDGKHLW